MWTKKNDVPEEEYPHKHRCELDGEGNGVTVHTSLGPVHTHDVVNYEVQDYKGHTHEMQDGSADIRGYENSGEPKFEKDDDQPRKRIKEQIAEREEEIRKGQEEMGKVGEGLRISIEVCVPTPGDSDDKSE